MHERIISNAGSTNPTMIDRDIDTLIHAGLTGDAGGGVALLDDAPDAASDAGWIDGALHAQAAKRSGDEEEDDEDAPASGDDEDGFDDLDEDAEEGEFEDEDEFEDEEEGFGEEGDDEDGDDDEEFDDDDDDEDL